MQILTSSVKLFLIRPGDGHEIIQGLLNMVTHESENPDIRDRGYIYWRLLSKSPEVAKKIVFADRPEISYDSYTLDSILLDRLVENIGSLASVFYKPPEAFVKKLRDILNQKLQDKNNFRDIDYDFEQGDPEELLANQDQADYNAIDLNAQKKNASMEIFEEKPSGNPQPVVNNTPATDNLLDLDDMLGGTTISEKQPTPPQSNSNPLDLLDSSNSQPIQNQSQPVANENPLPQSSESKNIKIPLTVLSNKNNLACLH